MATNQLQATGMATQCAGKPNRWLSSLGIAGGVALGACALTPQALAQAAAGGKPNIILMSDDFGYGDSGPYGGGEGRGMPTPSLDRMAERFKELGMDVGQPRTPEQLAQSLRVASDKHGANLKTIGFKPD